MTADKATAKLVMLLEKNPRAMVKVSNPTGERITGEQLASDLVEWFNSTELDNEDIFNLFHLARDGQFEAWNCPTCGERCFIGNPDDWGSFQGVRNQDYVSYPGLGIGRDDRRCDSCRMWGKGSEWFPEGYHLERD